MRAFFCAVAGVAICGVIYSQNRVVPTPTLAAEFIATLNESQKAKALKTFSDDYRTNWQYVPIARQGVNLGDLNDEQKEKAAKLLKSALSESGYKKIETIKSLEDVLFEMEGKNPTRDKRLYTFTFFDTPTNKGSWAWRYEGHHVSLNFTYHDGKLVSSTPQFFGTNPAEVRSGPLKGTRALAEEEDRGFEFLAGLTDEQKTKAVIDAKAPADIVTSNSRKAGIQSKKGLAWSDLTPAQQKALLKLVEVHAKAQATEEFQRRMGSVEKESLVFAWMGSTERGKGHYYRIQGSKFLIEHDNTQNNANHIHAVWRDFEGDFGADVLAKHYADVAHSPAGSK
jgi:hypothetical protein